MIFRMVKFSDTSFVVLSPALEEVEVHSDVSFERCQLNYAVPSCESFSYTHNVECYSPRTL